MGPRTLTPPATEEPTTTHTLLSPLMVAASSARAWQVRPDVFLPPAGHPQRREWQGRRVPLMWVPLHSVDPLAHLRHRVLSAVTPGWLDPAARPAITATTSGGGAGGVVPSPASSSSGGSGGGSSSPAGAPELLLATPDWLYCLVGRWAITAGWPSLAPRSVCAVLHLVECRSQFVRPARSPHHRSPAAPPLARRALHHAQDPVL